MKNKSILHNLSYQILNLLSRDLFDHVLKGDSFLIKENQIKIINLFEESKKELKELLNKCESMGFQINASGNSIIVSLPVIHEDKIWDIIPTLTTVPDGSFNDLINQKKIVDLLIDDIKKNKNNWELDEENHLINNLKKIIISFKMGSGIVFMRVPSVNKKDISSDYFNLCMEESLKLISFVDLHFSFDLSEDKAYLMRIQNLKKTLG